MFKIKICGITSPTDIVRAVEFGADAIGLNFYTKSLRNVTDDEATKILAAIESGSGEPGGQVSTVGVFVNSTVAEIRQRTETLRLAYVQLHGEETVEMVAELDGIPVIRAIRLQPGLDAEETTDAANAEIRRWSDAGVSAVLLDAAAPGEFGGTGKRLDWEMVSQLTSPVPIILAGGLNAENVSRAIATASPAAVDVASGIETFPGKKDETQMRQFIENAAAAFAG